MAGGEGLKKAVAFLRDIVIKEPPGRRVLGLASLRLTMGDAKNHGAW